MPRQRLRGAVEHLLAQGYDVPPELHKLARIQDCQKRGVRQVWKCPSKKCDDYESMVVISACTCRFCGRTLRKDLDVPQDPNMSD